MMGSPVFFPLWSALLHPIWFEPIWGQELPKNEFINFRHNCSTPDLIGTTLTAPCLELCSVCHSFYVSSIDLNKCVGYDGKDTLVPKKESVFKGSTDRQ